MNSPNYDARGNRTRITHPDGAYFEYEYDSADRLFHLSENGPATTLASIFYDGEGRRDWIDRDASGASTDYGYDPVARLDLLTHDLDGAGSANDATLGFGYNPASQIVTRTLTNNAYEYPLAPSVKSYAVNGRNQYTQVGGTTHSWDANGNLTSDGLTNFGYDTENRLVSASGAKNATLAYDPLGRLYQVTSGANTTRFVYDGDRLIAEYNGSGTLLRRYVHGPGVDEPLIWYEGSSVSSASRRYLHANHQGSIVATSNASGAKLQIHYYDAYGVTATANTWRFQYTGQAAIPELGLLYYKARFYNPGLGRFLQTDPIGYEDDLNFYAYLRNDPINATDPSGKCGPLCSGVIGAVVGGGFELGWQLIVEDVQLKNVDWGKVGTRAWQGGLVGSGMYLGGATATLVGGSEVVGIAGGGAFTSAAITAAEGGGPLEVANSGIAGALSGPASQTTRTLLNKFGQPLVPELAARRAAGYLTPLEEKAAIATGVATREGAAELSGELPDRASEISNTPHAHADAQESRRTQVKPCREGANVSC